MKNASFDLTQFTQLQAACIDASSLIYCSKIGLLDLLQQSLRLYTLPEIIAETRFQHLNLTLIPSTPSESGADQKLFFCAIQQQLPLISEDKQLLRQAEQHGLHYYNTLMMLNFLLYQRLMAQEEYHAYLNKLRPIARYSPAIWHYGAQVYELIMREYTSFPVSP